MANERLTRIEHFLQDVTELDGSPAVSDAKYANIALTQRTMVIEEDDRIVALGVVANHQHADGSSHWAVETALEPGLRFAEFEGRLLATALELVPSQETCSVWSHRGSLDVALEDIGFSVSRELAFLTVHLPLDSGGAAGETRPFQSVDLPEVLAVNRSAFKDHREAASLTAEDFSDQMGRDGFSNDGLRIAESGGGIVGYCWTRVHTNGDGEIYRVAVTPEHQGTGLGRSLLGDGFDFLAKQNTVKRGTLWVDTSNQAAMALYADMGMKQSITNREFRPTTSS